MRPFLIAALLATSTAATAREDVAIPIADLIAQPKKHIGESIVVRRIRCVDPGGSSFVCAARNGRRALRLRASALGPFTTLAIAEKLIGPCKGLAKLDSPTCTFDILMTPTASEKDDGPDGPETVIVIHSGQIEMYTPRRI